MFQKAIVEALWTDMKLNVKYLLNRPTDAAEPLPTPDPTRARKDCLMDNEFDSFLGSDNGEQQNDTEVKSFWVSKKSLFICFQILRLSLLAVI